MSAALAYLAVPVETLVGEAKIEFDLYVQLNAKHVLYLRKGGVFDSERLGKIREKNVRNMWILAENEGQYRRMIELRMEQAYDPKSAMPMDIRARQIHAFQSQAAEALMRTPADIGLYQETLQGAKRFTEFLANDANSLKMMLSVPNVEKNVGAHGVTVAALAVHMARKLGFADAKDLHLLALGCMIHDAGHMQQQGVSFGRKLDTLTADEQKLRKEHPLLGARACAELSHFDQHVVQIILEHEELIDGTGYPKGLKEKQMHAYSMIAATANSFDRIVLAEGETHQGAARRLVVDKIGRHSLAHFNVIKSLIQSISG